MGSLRERIGRRLHEKVPEGRILFDGVTPSPGEHTRWPCMTCLVEAENMLAEVADVVREEWPAVNGMGIAAEEISRFIENGGTNA